MTRCVGQKSPASGFLLTVAFERGFGVDIHEIHSISLAARCRAATWSSTLVDGLAKNRVARNSDHVTLHARRHGKTLSYTAPWRSA